MDEIIFMIAPEVLDKVMRRATDASVGNPPVIAGLALLAPSLPRSITPPPPISQWQIESAVCLALPVPHDRRRTAPRGQRRHRRERVRCSRAEAIIARDWGTAT